MLTCSLDNDDYFALLIDGPALLLSPLLLPPPPTLQIALPQTKPLAKMKDAAQVQLVVKESISWRHDRQTTNASPLSSSPAQVF